MGSGQLTQYHHLLLNTKRLYRTATGEGNEFKVPDIKSLEYLKSLNQNHTLEIGANGINILNEQGNRYTYQKAYKPF